MFFRALEWGKRQLATPCPPDPGLGLVGLCASSTGTDGIGLK